MHFGPLRSAKPHSKSGPGNQCTSSPRMPQSYGLTRYAPGKPAAGHCYHVPWLACGTFSLQDDAAALRRSSPISMPVGEVTTAVLADPVRVAGSFGSSMTPQAATARSLCGGSGTAAACVTPTLNTSKVRFAEKADKVRVATLQVGRVLLNVGNCFKIGNGRSRRFGQTRDGSATRCFSRPPAAEATKEAPVLSAPRWLVVPPTRAPADSASAS